MTAAVRAVTKLPVWVKMSPEAGDIKGVGLACEEAGADALTAINTIRGLAIDRAPGRPRLANRTGGLSGPALKPIALRMVWELARAVKIPVIGIGGIATADDAVEFLLAGATAVQVGTASFADPTAAQEGARRPRRRTARARGLAARDLIGKLRPAEGAAQGGPERPSRLVAAVAAALVAARADAHEVGLSRGEYVVEGADGARRDRLRPQGARRPRGRASTPTTTARSPRPSSPPPATRLRARWSAASR